MLEQISVTFEFDPETKLVSNLSCFVDGIESKKKTTRTTKKKDVVLEDENIITREDNKLVFNNRCVATMELEWQNRVIVKYETPKGGGKPYPVIGKDISFDEEGSGNKLTKTDTVSYRGKANDILKEYGTEFTLEEFKDGIWKLISTSGGNETLTYEEPAPVVEELDIITLTDEGHKEDDNIQEMTFKL